MKKGPGRGTGWGHYFVFISLTLLVGSQEEHLSYTHATYPAHEEDGC